MEYIDEDGEYNIHPKHLSNMLDLVKTKEDFDTVVEAYYNFKGHKTSFSNNTVDKLVVTAVRIGQPEKVFDIINHHHYLLYYPHIKTVNLVLVGLFLILFKAYLELFGIITGQRNAPQLFGNHKKQKIDSA